MSMTNREWLYSLDVADLSDWFDAEHVEEPNGTSDGARAALDDENDSREKLEADVRKYVTISITSNHDNDGVLAPAITVLEWLDRQAAITEQECARRWQQIAEDRDRAERRNDELRISYDRLKRERDSLAADLLACNREHESLRKALGVAIDHAHEIVTLVDLEGNVIS